MSIQLPLTVTLHSFCTHIPDISNTVLNVSSEHKTASGTFQDIYTVDILHRPVSSISVESTMTKDG